MSVCELMTLLKQYEAAAPGRDVRVLVERPTWNAEAKRMEPALVSVEVNALHWAKEGAVIMALEGLP